MPVVHQPTVERRSMSVRTCSVCMDGVYVTRLETDAYAGPGALRRVGIDSSEAGILWHVESCERCGHVQIFRRDLAQDST